MRVLVTGGGTGGHIYPALAIARGIKEQEPDTDILFVGTAKGMEADIVPSTGLPFKTVTVEGLKRKISFQALMTLLKTCKGCFEGYKIIKDFKPTIVVGTGGYVCGPVVMIAALFGIPTLIHEQNAYPGITNKILARIVKKVAVTFPQSGKYFKAKTDIIVTGLPVRPEIQAADRNEGITALGLDKDKFTLLVVGGSRGARSLNNAMVEVIAQSCNQPGIQIVHMTGKTGYDETVQALKERGIDLAKCGNVTVTPYLYNMDDAMAAADLIVCRAGATTIAELTVCGLPSILIPYPYASDNHQEYNARALVNNGAAMMILDRELTGVALWEKIKRLSKNKDELATMSGNSKQMGKPEALDKLLKLVKQLSK